MEDQELNCCEYPNEQPPYPYFPPQDEPVAVYVDTDLRTHLAVVMSPFQTFSALKHQISLEHFNCFPKSGRILIKQITMIIDDKKYHLSDNMLIKSAFQGIDRPWVVFAEAYKPIGNSELPSHTDVKHIKPAPQNLKPKHVEPPSQYHQKSEHLNLSHQNDIPMHVQPSPQNHTLTHVDPSYQNHTLMHVDPSSPHHYEPKTYVTPSHQLRPSSQDRQRRPVKPSSQNQGTPNKSEQKKKKGKNGKKDIANVNNKTNVVSNYGSQRKNVKKELNEKTDKQGQGAVSNAGKDTGTKPGEGHHDTSAMLMEVASDDIVTDLKGNSPNIPENINKENETLNFESPSPGPEAKKSKSKKKGGIDGVSQNHPATPVKGPAILENNGIETDREVSPAQWNNAPESLSQHVPLNSDNTSKKRKASESEQQSRKIAEKISSDLDNVPELLSQDEIRESRKTSECEKEIAEDVAPVKLENTAKKRKTSKAKNSGAENQDLSSRRPNVDEKVDGTKHLRGEVSQPDDIGKPEESVETMSVKVKKSRNRKAVPEDPLVTHAKVRPDEEIKEMATPIAVFQSDRSKKKSQKKQPVRTEDLSSVIEHQHADESMMKEDVPVKVDETLTECDANDALLKTENTGKIQKTNDNDRQCRTADVSSSLLSDVSKVVLSQDESLKLVEKEKEIKEDAALSKLENNAKKRKNKAKSCGTENQEWSRRRQNEDEKTDDGSKVSGAILDMGMDTPKRADDVLTDSKSSDARNQNGVKQGELHDNFSQKPDLESNAAASAVIDEVLQQLQLEKPLTCKKKTKKTDQASSIDTSSNGYNLVGSKKNLGSAKTSKPQISNTVQKQDYSTPKKVVDSDRSKSSKARKIYREEEVMKRQNVEEDNTSLRKSSHLTSKGILNTSEKKNGRLVSSRAIFEDGNSSTSNDEDGGYASSSSGTLAPDNSEDSEVESGGVVKSKDDCSKGTRSIKAESSGLKLESILKSSSRYKKARLMASQSQGESELPEFVPDSQGF